MAGKSQVGRHRRHPCGNARGEGSLRPVLLPYSRVLHPWHRRLVQLLLPGKTQTLPAELGAPSLLQIIADQLFLAASVYFSGGRDSPFIYFFIFHVVISGIILPWRHAYMLAGMAVLLPSLVIGSTHYHILPQIGIIRHEHLIGDGSVVMLYGLAFVGTIALTTYCVTYLSKQLYAKNEEVLKLYRLSERLRSSIRLEDVIRIIEEELRDFAGASASY
jgi:hypothetical protein